MLLMLILCWRQFGQDFEVEVKATCNMNSTLGSVVPLAMFFRVNLVSIHFVVARALVQYLPPCFEGTENFLVPNFLCFLLWTLFLYRAFVFCFSDFFRDDAVGLCELFESHLLQVQNEFVIICIFLLVKALSI